MFERIKRKRPQRTIGRFHENCSNYQYKTGQNTVLIILVRAYTKKISFLKILKVKMQPVCSKYAGKGKIRTGWCRVNTFLLLAAVITGIAIISAVFSWLCYKNFTEI